MRRVFWFAVGAGAAVYAMVKIRSYLDRATPQAVGQRVAGQLVQTRERALDFADRVRAAVAESEAELRDSLGLHEQP